MIIEEADYLAHYGILRRSGRYPWGSGGDESTRNRDFLGYVDNLRKEGLSETEIARGLGTTTTQLRAARTIARTQQKQADIAMAQRLKAKGMSNVAIGERMEINESQVRALLAPGAKDKAAVLQATSNMLRDQVNAKGFVDVGTGVEHHVGVSRTKLDSAIAQLREEGYELHTVQVDQLGTKNKTLIKVLAPPGTTYRDVASQKDKIKQVTSFSEDGGRSYVGQQPPLSVSSSRVKVRYAEEGGAAADGVIYVRRNKPDISLGGASYAQVRIAVDGAYYLKGMAMYKDDLPAGVDLEFNTNKSSTGNKLDAMKRMKDDPENPFGSVVRQIVDADGKVSSAMNIVNEEGTWDTWSRSLSSQFLSKQSPALAKSQLDMTYDRRKRELDEIMALNNPSVRRRLLESYADDADAAAVHLKAAALPRQRNSVILPVNSMKETEIYAPNFRNGERVVLVRHPHGGIFEIPELTVNNRHPEAKKLLGRAPDAVGIHSKVAERLSGADFDGDTVLVIPNNQRRVKTGRPLEDLTNFDPQRAYPGYEGMQKMDARTKASEMGKVSNLITDMTIRGASNAELARAVRHSMVVIDAEKHGLDWKQSAIDNGISQLKAKYQGGANAGAATLISRASARKDVPERKGAPRIDPITGKKTFQETGATYPDAKGRPQLRTQRSTQLAETDDARTLSSGTPIEMIYAAHSNRLKDLANQARRSAVSTRGTPYSPSARTTYSAQVASLDSKLRIALRNAPLERQAQVLANAEVSQKRQANPDMEPSELKKVKNLALAKARARTGAGKQRIDITDLEWEAIQAGAISTSKLNQILNNADLDSVKRLATPKSASVMTPAKQQRAKAMLASDYTQAEIADALGVSLSTLKEAL